MGFPGEDGDGRRTALYWDPWSRSRSLGPVAGVGVGLATNHSVPRRCLIPPMCLTGRAIRSATTDDPATRPSPRVQRGSRRVASVASATASGSVWGCHRWKPWWRWYPSAMAAARSARWNGSPPRPASPCTWAWPASHTHRGMARTPALRRAPLRPGRATAALSTVPPAGIARPPIARRRPAGGSVVAPHSLD